MSPISLPFRAKSPRRVATDSGFSLIELLTVVAVMAGVMAMVAPAVTGVKNSGAVNQAVYDVAGVLQTARSYATANNTYVWVGFYEESEPSPSVPAKPGTGRVVMSIVASGNGTLLSGSMTAAAGLVQVYKLVKDDNMHVIAFPSVGGTGSTFSTRPAPSNGSAVWQVGSASLGTAPSSQSYFQYPLAGTAQYTFTTLLQFSPRGEVELIEPSLSPQMQPLIEIGLESTRGATIPANEQNLAAVQITGIAGNVNIYRQ